MRETKNPEKCHRGWWLFPPNAWQTPGKS